MINFNSIVALDKFDNVIEIEFAVKEVGSRWQINIVPSRDCEVKEVIVFSGEHNFSKNAYLYTDGYSKLSQYGGKPGKIKALTYFSDGGHYKMPQVAGYSIGYNFLQIKEGDYYKLVGASSCNYYRTEFRISSKKLAIVQCLENKKFLAKQSIELEEMYFAEGNDINSLLDIFADGINENHPPKIFNESPVGWCSWYCIGPNISENKIFENLSTIKAKLPELKYIQIDDGYQPHMGDWLKVGEKFNRNMKEICEDIKKQGFEPAIWFAPFIASQNSELYKTKPDLFVKDANNNPLCTKEFTFKGWRDSPWYCMDGSNPETLQYIYNVVHTIYHDWGVKYFKLDANMWGALPFGNRFDPQCTSVEAYRKGMQSIWDATGNDAFILGCNAPMWPSLGLVSGMRITGDVMRSMRCMVTLSNECFKRNWMNKLWQNDPDCLIMADEQAQVMDAGARKIENKGNSAFYKFNNVYIRASGGIVLSGDYVSKYSQQDISRAKRIINSPKIPAKFDDKLEFGVITYDNIKEYCIFNKTKLGSKIFNIPIKQNAKVVDMYYNKPLSVNNGTLTLKLKKYDCAWIKVEE